MSKNTTVNPSNKWTRDDFTNRLRSYATSPLADNTTDLRVTSTPLPSTPPSSSLPSGLSSQPLVLPTTLPSSTTVQSSTSSETELKTIQTESVHQEVQTNLSAVEREEEGDNIQLEAEQIQGAAEDYEGEELEQTFLDTEHSLLEGEDEFLEGVENLFQQGNDSDSDSEEGEDFFDTQLERSNSDSLYEE
jgi:hypothetical protein